MGINFAVVILIIALTNAPSSASLVTFIFGDSLAEVGNNNYLKLSLAKSNFPFYGIDFAGGKATGRFTNGRTVGDIISAKLGIPSPPSYLSISEDGDALLKGANYASGGAGILNETGLYFIQTLSFHEQINKFQRTKESIKAKIGEGEANKLCNEAVYIIGIGSNDYVNNFLQPYLADASQYTHDEFVELLISTLGKQLTRLYQLGARRMVFHGLGPLGCIPAQRAKSSKGECLSQVNLWVQQFNSKVEKLIVNLNSHYYPSAQIKFADTYPAVLDLIEKPTAYGMITIILYYKF
ncbi:hypothetical protein RD792_001095 [Penstemon davidsonii]|uniref:Uncharacterized protein n=1 Tax=Penstemon davidsonii TaxID=160366 RepID=A0ABR0DNP2_9LAMI|nr:hypothetical protein RD792_001095 [Penstemon davidsonii]